MDEATFTHIVYLHVDSGTVLQPREADTQKRRSRLPAEHLHEWQQQEMLEMRQICYDSGILVTVVKDLERLPSLLESFQMHNEEDNEARAEAALDDAVASADTGLRTILAFDGDNSLIGEDTGTMFFDRLPNRKHALKDLFESEGYSYTSFRQAMLLCEEAADDEQFDTICSEVASASTIHPEIESLLHLIEGQMHVAAIVIICGLRLVFEKVLERHNLHKVAKVIGGGRLLDGYVVTPDLKGALVGRRQEEYDPKVWGFGHSPLDLPMLKQADRAIVVVGDEETRSRSMDAALRHAIEIDELNARQLLCPDSCRPRLDEELLPVIRTEEIAAEILRPHGGCACESKIRGFATLDSDARRKHQWLCVERSAPESRLVSRH
jgi:hypothetical protein